MTPADASAIMTHHARSFAPAARLLGRSDRDRVAQLYALCRIVDDLADEDGSDAARDRLNRIENELRIGLAQDSIAMHAVQVFGGPGNGLAAFADLVEGVRGDMEPVAFETMGQLDSYCYAVAGTVGVMICDLFDVPSQYHGPAAALGQAMQLTNICRDVLEDAENGRRYLPAELCQAAPAQLAAASAPARVAVSDAVKNLLMRADTLYAQGALGYAALPVRLRCAVAAAAGMYRGIGHELCAQGADALAGRVRLRPLHKLRLSLWALVGLATGRFRMEKEAAHA